jgi:hypothetical protein
MSPLALNQLLKYMENNGEGAVVRPWVWIALLFIGPTVNSLANEYYLYITGRTMIRTEAIITQLIFEHSLRIRIKAETDVIPRDGLDSTVADSDDPASDTGSTPGKGKQPKGKHGPAEKTRLESNNLIGMINNLVTTDLGNVTDARDFLYAGM